MNAQESLAPQLPVPPDQRRHVIVIGAGVVGLSTALWLLRAGHAVTVIDRDPPRADGNYEHAASFGNAATIAFGACLPVASPGVLASVPRMLLDRRGPLSLFWRDLPGLMPWLIAFIRSSTPAEVDRIIRVLGQLLRLSEAGHAPLMQESGAESLFRRNGCLYLYKSAQKFAAAKNDIDMRQREGVRMEILDADAIRAAEPGLAPLYHKGIRFSDTYFLDNPHQYALGLARSVEARGGRFISGEAVGVSSFEPNVGVRVNGDWLLADRIVVAGGAWSKRLAASAGDKVLLDSERGYHVNFPDDGGRLNAPCCYPEHGFYLTPLQEGLRAAGTVELGGLGAPLRPVRTSVIAQVARELVPGLGKPGREWLGFRPSMPDSLPVVGPSPKDPRIIYAFGHGHIGLTLAGITGRMVSDLVSGQELPMDISALRPTRF
jgi:D-amino-acid dehydrogenase